MVSAVTGVPVRQRVICVPKRLRGLLADRPAAVAALTKIFLDEIERSLCAAAGLTSAANTPASARPRLRAISFLHRFGSALNHHVHLHACVTDGVFVPATAEAARDTPPAFSCVPAGPANHPGRSGRAHRAGITVCSEPHAQAGRHGARDRERRQNLRLSLPPAGRLPTGANSCRSMTTATRFKRRPTSCPRSTSPASDRRRTRGIKASDGRSGRRSAARREHRHRSGA